MSNSQAEQTSSLDSRGQKLTENQAQPCLKKHLLMDLVWEQATKQTDRQTNKQTYKPISKQATKQTIAPTRNQITSQIKSSIQICWAATKLAAHRPSWAECTSVFFSAPGGSVVVYLDSWTVPFSPKKRLLVVKTCIEGVWGCLRHVCK